MLSFIHRVGRRLMLPAATRRLEDLRARARAVARRTPGVEHVDGLQVEHVDLMSLYMEYKDIFFHRIYHFHCDHRSPRVLDCGSYIGMATLYTKGCHPGARVTCLEPDPTIADVLDRNIEANGLTDVNVVRAALARDSGQGAFQPDGSDGGRLVKGESAVTVPTVRLSDFLDEPVHFLKMNIEGAELGVLQEAEGRLERVEQLAIEYHGWAHGAQDLGPILDLLDRRGFRYLINHVDYETNPAVRPPFALDGRSTWFAIVHARRAA